MKKYKYFVLIILCFSVFNKSRDFAHYPIKTPGAKHTMKDRFLHLHALLNEYIMIRYKQNSVN